MVYRILTHHCIERADRHARVTNSRQTGAVIQHQTCSATYIGGYPSGGRNV